MDRIWVLLVGSVLDEAHASSLGYSSENEIESPWILSLNFQGQSSEYDVIWVMTIAWNGNSWWTDQLRLRWMIYLVVLADAAENVRDTIRFEYCLASSSEWTKSPVLWAEIGESSLIGPELVQETTDKSVALEGHSVFRKKGKLAPRYVGPFDILERIGLVAYRLRLLEELNSVHDTFHVSNLKKCLADANLHVPLDEIKVDKTLRFVEEPVEIMDREIKKLKRRKIALVKVRWNSKRGPEFTWEHEDQMRIKSASKVFSGRVTPLFPTMMVQNQSQMGEDKAVHKELGDSLVWAATTVSSLEAEQDSGNITQTRSKAIPNEFSSQGTNSGGGPRCQETMGNTISQTRFENVSKHSNDSLIARGNTLQSDEDRLKLDELMAICTNLQNKVLDLEQTKTSQDSEIASLKRRVNKLEKKNRSRTHKLKRLYKVGLTTRVESSDDEERLGEDASKQGRIDAINADEEITLVSVHDMNVSTSEEVTEEVVKVSSASAATTTTAKITTVDDITLAQALEEIKSKGILIEPVKKKDQILLDEETALNLQAKFNEEERLAREKAKKEKKANIALIETWDDIQVKIDADHQLAKRLQAQEQEQLSIEEKATLFQQLLEKRRKHFAAKRAKEKRNKPPTKAQQRKIMCTYLKNMEGYKLKDLKLKGFDSIQEMFDIAFKRVNTFEDFRTELVEGKEKRAGTELAQEITKKQKVEDDKETTELKQCLEIIPDEEEVTIDAIPLAVKSPSIVGWKIHKEGRKSYYQIIRADGKSQMYMIFSHMLKSFDMEDLETLYKLIYMLVEKKYPLTPSTLTKMLEKNLMIDYESEMAYQLLKFIIKQLKKQRSVWKHPPGVDEALNEET
ncbi:hypothetical protein Tco_1132714 [Tanacetum coccineum]|uniref:Tf2-1-like SH3-like domain-containing protein n=1 Tax=Tanacetum coccineum TaxID=301880 RepID=A0ABQ5JFN1_9ASTR